MGALSVLADSVFQLPQEGLLPEGRAARLPTCGRGGSERMNEQSWVPSRLRCFPAAPHRDGGSGCGSVWASRTTHAGMTCRLLRWQRHRGHFLSHGPFQVALFRFSWREAWDCVVSSHQSYPQPLPFRVGGAFVCIGGRQAFRMRCQAPSSFPSDFFWRVEVACCGKGVCTSHGQLPLLWSWAFGGNHLALERGPFGNRCLPAGSQEHCSW